MIDSQTSFWTPARVAVMIGAVLLVVALAYLVRRPESQPLNPFFPCPIQWGT